MEIRTLHERDAAIFWRLRLEALQTEPFAFSASAEEHQSTTLETTAQRLRGMVNGNFLLGAFDGEQLIGTAGFYKEAGLKAKHRGGVWGVYVSKDWRGRKVGRALLSALVEKASEDATLEQITLTVAASQQAAVQLYRGLGFVTFGMHPKALKIGQDYVDHEHMLLQVR